MDIKMKINIELLENVKKYIEKNHIEEYCDIDVVLTEACKIMSKNCSLAEFDEIDDTWQETVFYLIDSKGYKDSEVYKRANISKQTFSKIRSNALYQPNKDTAIQMCFGLKLDLDESIELLEKAGYALSKSIYRDLIVQYFIENSIYEIDELNSILYEYKLKLFPIN